MKILEIFIICRTSQDGHGRPYSLLVILDVRKLHLDYICYESVLASKTLPIRSPCIERNTFSPFK
jgi:hypothetical protein